MRSPRLDCLDHVLIVNEAHHERILRGYAPIATDIVRTSVLLRRSRLRKVLLPYGRCPFLTVGTDTQDKNAGTIVWAG